MKSDFAKFEKKMARVNLQRLMAGRVPGLSPNPQGQGLYQQPDQQNFASPLPKMKKPRPKVLSKFKRPTFTYKRPVMAKRPVGGLMMKRPLPVPTPVQIKVASESSMIMGDVEEIHDRQVHLLNESTISHEKGHQCNESHI